MHDTVEIFPLPPGSDMSKQAEAMAWAAWIMGSPDGAGAPPAPDDPPVDVTTGQAFAAPQEHK